MAESNKNMYVMKGYSDSTNNLAADVTWNEYDLVSFANTIYKMYFRLGGYIHRNPIDSFRMLLKLYRENHKKNDFEKGILFYIAGTRLFNICIGEMPFNGKYIDFYDIEQMANILRMHYEKFEYDKHDQKYEMSNIEYGWTYKNYLDSNSMYLNTITQIGHIEYSKMKTSKQWYKLLKMLYSKMTNIYKSITITFSKEMITQYLAEMTKIKYNAEERSYRLPLQIFAENIISGAAEKNKII